MLRRTTCLAVVVSLSLGSPAAAQDGGVVLDEGSPTGKEYAIPLEQARRDATGRRGSAIRAAPTPEAEAAAPLFGEGVGDAASGTGDGDAETGGASQRSPRGDNEGEGGATGSGPPPTAAAPADRTRVGPRDVATPDGGAGDMAAVLGGAAGALLIGGMAGVAVRRRAAGRRRG